MSETNAAPVPDQGLLARAVGIIVSPGKTYETVVAHPRPATILLAICLVLGLATAGPQFTEQGRAAVLEAQTRAIEQRTHQTITPQMAETMASIGRYSGYATFGSMFIFVPVISLLVAAVFWAIFNAILGGTASFKQVLAIVTHAQVIAALGAVVSAPIIWVKGIQSAAGPFNLGALAPMLDPSSFVATCLSSLNVFSLWQIVVSAIGLAVLYRRKVSPIAAFLVIAYLLMVAGVTAVVSSFMNR